MFFRALLFTLFALQIKKGYKAASAGAKELEASNCLEKTAKNYADKVCQKKKGGTCARKKNDITLLGHPLPPPSDLPKLTIFERSQITFF